MNPTFELLDIGNIPLVKDIQLYIMSARITYEIKEEGVADECEISMWFDTLNNIDIFLNQYVRVMVNMTVGYGWTGINTQEIAKFQIRGVSITGDSEGGYKLTLKGYSPILEGNDKVAVGPFSFGSIPMRVSECVVKCCVDNGWLIRDETGQSTIDESNDKPEKPYVVEQIDDSFEKYAQFIQRLANTIGFDYHMRYHKVSGLPIVYFKPRNSVNNKKYDFKYRYNIVGEDPLKLILDYTNDISVTKTVDNVAMADGNITPLQEFQLDEVTTTPRGTDGNGLDTPPKGSGEILSGSERQITAIKPVLEDAFMKGLEDIAEVQMATLGNPLARQGQAVWIENADMLTNGYWNVIKVTHDFDFKGGGDYKTSWTLSKNTIKLSDETMFEGKDSELGEFELDSEEEKE